jgi:hypothetical protein
MEACAVATIVVPSSTSKVADGVVIVASFQRDVGGPRGSNGKPGKLKIVSKGSEYTFAVGSQHLT